MKKILIITHYYPPHTSVASLRLYGMAKYLSEKGFEVKVVSTKKYSFDGPQINNQPKLNVEVFEIPYWPFLEKEQFAPAYKVEKQIVKGSGVSAAKKINRKVRKYIGSLLDVHDLWIWSAKLKCMELHNEWPFDTIISSYSPPATHKLSAFLRKRLDIKWIADFRDLWSDNYNTQAGFPLSILEKRHEKKLLKHADLITTVSEPLKNSLQKRLKREDVHVIRNGFYKLHSSPAKKIRKDKITLSYTGTIYEKQDPKPLFDAIAGLINDKKISSENIEVNFFGDGGHVAKNEDYKSLTFIKFYNKISRDEILKIQTESTALVFLEWNASTQKGVLTGKLFEYLASGTPILSVGECKSESSEIIEKTKTGTYCSSEKDIRNFIMKLYENNLDFAPDISEINQYSFAKSIDKLIGLIK